MRGYGAVVLAGGASTRLGYPKHMLKVGGELLLRRVVGRLEGADGVVVSTSKGAEPEVEGVLSGLDVEVVVDAAAGMGPLGGIAAGLAALRCEWAAVCACDMPFVSLEHLDRLFEHRAGQDAVIPVSQGGRQTLHALYRKKTVLPACELLLRRGGGSVLDALEGLCVRYVPAEEERCFFNVNSAPDLDQLILEDE